MKANILTLRHVADSRALTPLLVNQRRLREAGVVVRFFYGDDARLYDADCVIFDGGVYRKCGTDDLEGEVVRALPEDGLI